MVTCWVGCRSFWAVSLLVANTNEKVIVQTDYYKYQEETYLWDIIYCVWWLETILHLTKMNCEAGLHKTRTQVLELLFVFWFNIQVNYGHIDGKLT